MSEDRGVLHGRGNWHGFLPLIHILLLVMIPITKAKLLQSTQVNNSSILRLEIAFDANEPKSQ